VETVGAAITTRNHVLIRHLREDGARIQGQTHSYEMAHEERLMSGVCPSHSSSLYLAMLDSFREIERYTHRLADALGKPPPKA
jgi:Na+/phosphate symporter